MSKCINVNHPEYKELLKNLNVNPLILKSEIGVWQERNDTDRFPTIEEYNEYKNNKNSVQYQFKSVNIISNNINKVNQWFKQLKDTDIFWNKLQKDLQIPKEQIELLKQSYEKLLNIELSKLEKQCN